MEDVSTSAKLGVKCGELDFNGARLLQLIGLVTSIELIFGKPRPLVVFEAYLYDTIALFLYE